MTRPLEAEPMAPGRGAASSAAQISPFADAVADETRLLGELIALLRRQRQAVVEDQIELLDEATVAVHRVLDQLAEAQHARTAVQPSRPTSAEQQSWEQLRSAARTLAQEVTLTQDLLRRALGAGDEMARMILGSGEVAGGAFLINRTG